MKAVKSGRLEKHIVGKVLGWCKVVIKLESFSELLEHARLREWSPVQHEENLRT